MDYISIDSSADVIEHFGIKGMRWGVRSRHAGLSESYNRYKLAKKKNWRDRNHVKKEHLAEYDEMDKILKSYNRPYHDGPKLEKWDNAYNRQVELTKTGMNYKYARAKKAYNDYINYR